MLSRVTFLSVFATFVALSISQQCFGLDGSQLDDTFAPCNPKAKHSGCCATNKAPGADLCLNNGLCMSTTGEITGMIWQAGCTDETGKDIACPRVCPGGMSSRSPVLICILTIYSRKQLRRPDSHTGMEHSTMRLRDLLLPCSQRSKKLLQQCIRTESHYLVYWRTPIAGLDSNPGPILGIITANANRCYCCLHRLPSRTLRIT
jgi:hypothetical protein